MRSVVCDEAIAVLRQVFQLERRIDDLQRRIDDFHEAAMKLTGAYAAGGSSGSATRSRVETNIVRSIDLERQMSRTRETLIKRRYDIQAAIDGMAEEEEKRLIELRYLDHLPWPAVMTKMELSEAACFRLRNRALKNFWKKFSR